MDREPVAVGLKVTVKVQEAPFARELPAALQEPAPEFTIVKSPELPPVVVGLILVAVPELLFVTVNVVGLLDEPTLMDPKFLLDGLSVTAPTTPVPLKADVCGLALSPPP